MIAFLADAFVKSTVILVLAAIVTICLRRSSASLRHLVWTLACGGVLALPLASALLPNWRVAGWPRLDVPMAFDANEQREPPPAAAASVAQAPHAVTPATTGAPAVRSSITLNWTALVLPVWLGGVLAVLIAVAIGMARIAWLEHITPPVEDEAWWLLVEDLSLEVGLTRQVRLLQAKGAAMPMTWGIRRPAILLPADADTWSAERRRDVLLHELAHVKRHDFFTQLIARIACAVYWFHPLVWLAATRLRGERERACDDHVLRAGADPSVYATHLLEIARDLRAARATVFASVAMARPAQLATRLLDVLDTRRRRDTLSARLAVPAWIVAIAVVVPLAAAAPRIAAPAPATRSIDTIPPVPAPVLKARRAPTPAGTSQDTTVVNALIARLKDENAGVRRAAAHSLGQLRDLHAVMPLIAVLADSDGEVRSAAVDALSELEDSRAIGPIAGLLKDPVADVRHNALSALSHWDQGVPTGPVVALLDDGSADVRREAVGLLEHLRARSAGPAIARLIHDPSADVRSAVVRALGELGEQSGAAAITEALSDPNPDVRENALGALNDLKAPIADATLINLMKDQNADVRQRAAELAGERSVVAAIPHLRRLIDDPRGDVREAATEALGHIADPAARQALQAALQSPDPKVRRAAAEALGQDP